jgi:hypothetical protein
MIRSQQPGFSLAWSTFSRTPRRHHESGGLACWASTDIVNVGHDGGMLGYQAAAHRVNQTEKSTLPRAGSVG